MEGNIVVANVEHGGKRYIKAKAQLTETGVIVSNRRNQMLFAVEAPQVIEGSVYVFGLTRVEASSACGCGQTRIEDIVPVEEIGGLDPNR